MASPVSKRGQYSEQQKRSTMKYLAENFETIYFKVRKGKKEKIAEFAKSKGMSMTAFLEYLVDKEAELDGFDVSVPLSPSQQRMAEKEVKTDNNEE